MADVPKLVEELWSLTLLEAIELAEILKKKWRPRSTAESAGAVDSTTLATFWLVRSRTARRCVPQQFT